MIKFKHLLLFSAAVVLSISACASSHAKVKNSVKSAATAKVVKAKVVKAKVDINKANIKTLRTVKGIGPKRAAGIVKYRAKHGQFKSIYGLSKVKGKGYGFSNKFIKGIATKITI